MHHCNRGRGSGFRRGGGGARGPLHRTRGSQQQDGALGWGSSRDASSRRGTSQGVRERGRRGHSRHDAKRLEKYGFKNLQSMADKNPDELVLDMTSEKCWGATESLVSDMSMDDRKIVLVLKVFSRACECTTTIESLLKLLSTLPKSPFMSVHMSNYINRMSSYEKEAFEREEELQLIISLLNELLERLPSCYADLPIPQLFFVVTILNSTSRLIDQTILSKVEELNVLKDEKARKVCEEERGKDKRSTRRNRRDEAALLDGETPPEDFRDLSVVPTQDDINSKEKPFVRRNIVTGRYNDAEHYLDVQFRLLREDFVRPLRDGINELLIRMGSVKMGPLQDIRVYHGVRILYPVYTSKGLTYQISFDVSRFKHVRWENSKRLIYGSLLCLSKDNFETIMLATVEHRDIKKLKEGLLEIKFTGMTGKTVLDKSKYEMVETTAYFEAYRHVLEGLQVIEPERIPFQRYIVSCEPELRPPAYLRNRHREAVTYDLTPIMKDDTSLQGRLAYLSLSKERKGKAVPILNKYAWPSADDLELDDSQLKAVQLALTSEFALIQGPPGTGKTYIGLKVVRVLLHNKEKWMRGTEDVLDEEEHEDLPIQRRRLHRQENKKKAATHPILVVCYTNHALDQFLEGIHQFNREGIVRIGGRSQSEVLKDCSLKEIKFKMKKNKEAPREIGRAYYDIRSELESISNEMKVASENLQKCMEQLVHEKELLKENHLTPELYNQLTMDKTTGYRRDKALCYWLGLMQNDSYESSALVQPIAVFPFNRAAKRKNVVNPYHEAHLHNAKPAPGLDGNPQGSYELDGARNSFIYIPNANNGLLDTRQSMTIVLFVYPMSLGSCPIVCFQSQGIIGIQISQNGEIDGKGVLEAAFNSRDGIQMKPLSRPVLRLNQWNYIAASYDFESGVYRLWHDGRLVQTLQNVYGPMEIGSQHPVSVGSMNRRDHNLFFEGRICGLHIFPCAIRKEQILGIAGIRDEDLEEEDQEYNIFEAQQENEEVDNDTLFEAIAEENQRVLEGDEVTRFGTTSVRLNTVATVDPFYEDERATADPYQWQVQNKKRHKRRLEKKIKTEMSVSDMMSSNDAERVKDIWALSLRNRWRLYRYWIDQLCQTYKQTIERYQENFEEGAKRLSEVESLQNQLILEKAIVIGMTTTGAAKYRHLIQKIKPRITIVEEAAEVLESHIITSLSPGCQHLILIGDHQQLRPNPTVYDLAKNYYLDMSLFERMVKVGMKKERLNAQHRMRPEIADMMSHIYDDLQNHESVLNFGPIKGVSSNIFFIEHNELEEYIEEGRSRSNIHEAMYLAALCRYFILQGYDRKQITILTMYTGQLIQLKKQMPRDFFSGVRVCAVDNFQGEENDIILLSLVRSNEDGKIGFLRTHNRVCVALSRAKKGFYCIGNIEMMCENEDLWRNIIQDMRAKNKVGKYLTLTCQNHPKNIIHASSSTDFLRAPEGGCMEPCATRLDCGHVCKSVCHPGDPDHKEYKCREKCTKMLCKDHKCPKLCWQVCGKCTVLVSKEIPGCLHQQQVPCYKNPAEFKCQAPCVKLLQCGLHYCTRKCSDQCDDKCRAKVMKTLKCGHDNELQCHEESDKVICKAPCGELLTCGHQCAGSCGECFQGRLHLPCKAKCGRQLFCGHLCKEPCTKNCPPCSQPCQNHCIHSQCKKKCGEPCKPCMMPCKWKCKHHQCSKLCGEPCDRPRCNRFCKKLLKCGHRCIGMCGEPCPNKCRVCNKDEVEEILFGTEDEPDARFVQIQPCGHIIEVTAMDQYMDSKEDDNLSIQLKGCPRCKTPIRTALRYGDTIKKTLADFENVKAKLVVPDYKLQTESFRLQAMLKSRTFHKNLIQDVEKIAESIEMSKGLTTEQLNMYENQINFLCFMSKVLSGIQSRRASRDETEEELLYRRSAMLKRKKVRVRVEEELSRTIEVLAEPIRKRITMLKSRFSDQEKEEINHELLRFALVASYHTLANQLQERDIDPLSRLKTNRISEALESEKRISKDDIEKYMKDIEELTKQYSLDVFYKDVTDEEKHMIVKAMGMAQGHWFKCPKGHIYCIGDCGGATVEAQCPECGSKIGGTSHTLRSDNTLAGEMDGARHAAWSDHTNNMRNFDFDDI